MYSILCFYESSQTYTNTVFEHLNSFSKYSANRWFYCAQAGIDEFHLDLSRFDVVVIHYSVRLPFDQISHSTARALAGFPGLKVLFIQDEYDYTHRAWHWIKAIGIHLVFTVVPGANIERVYPTREFPSTKFLSNLTGYVPDALETSRPLPPPSSRRLIIGYRGRPLPIRYGRLGMEKVEIGRIVKEYCDAKGIVNDIAMTEEARIYGPPWYDFIASCRAMLGSESGSNVFDWDGTLDKRIAEFRRLNPEATNKEIYEAVVRPSEFDGLMNQISPRIFEAIAARTVLVLFEGHYSGFLEPGKHYIPLKKDGSNIAEVIDLLHDGAYVDAMAEAAYRDVIGSEKYSYRSFVRWVDEEIDKSYKTSTQHRTITPNASAAASKSNPVPITTFPIRAGRPQLSCDTFFNTIRGGDGVREKAQRCAIFVWARLPEAVKIFLRPKLKRLLQRR